MIQSGDAGWFAVCPTWAFDTLRGDERVTIDAALAPQYRAAVRTARASLLALIESTSRALPSSDFLIGQRIRFLIDLGAADSAVTAARECRATRWWCASLAGYALAVAGRAVEAGVAFDSAIAALRPSERCRWNDFGFLLDPVARDEYERMSCASRDSVNARLWWLADPLFTVPGNERRVEQYSRKVQLALRRALDRDERFDWRYVAGGDALETMVTRYGWPSYLWWGGPGNDAQHSGYLKTAPWINEPGPLHQPYTTFEYSTKRQHLLATWKATLNPMSARATDWQINATDSGYTDIAAELRWWPAEHSAAPYPLYQLAEGQVAMLRRDSSVILATAVDLMTSGIPRALGSRVTARLVVTDSPDSLRVVAEHSGPVDRRLVLYGPIASRPVLVGIELPLVQPLRVAARTRFAITPVATLASMSPGDFAVSEPVILLAPVGDEPAPLETNAALAMMAASTKTPATRKIAVYWESYGFKPTDSVDVAVWIERVTAQGTLRRFGNALRVTTDLNTPVATTWHEPQPGTRTHPMGGRIPIIGRSVVLDVSRLPRGSYWLEVAVAKPGQEPVRNRRNFIVE
jgi:hypothetical protein